MGTTGTKPSAQQHDEGRKNRERCAAPARGINVEVTADGLALEPVPTLLRARLSRSRPRQQRRINERIRQPFLTAFWQVREKHVKSRRRSGAEPPPNAEAVCCTRLTPPDHAIQGSRNSRAPAAPRNDFHLADDDPRWSCGDDPRQGAIMSTVASGSDWSQDKPPAVDLWMSPNKQRPPTRRHNKRCFLNRRLLLLPCTILSGAPPWSFRRS